MALFFDDLLLSEIRERNDIIDIISMYTDLKRSGNRYVGLCPFHREKTPSFFVSKEDQLYYCFGCHEGGNIFTFVEKINNLDFIEAVKFLADRAGINLPEDSEEKPPEYQIKKRIYEINNISARFFHNSLIDNKEALDYLLKRGIDLKTIKNFGLGYAKDDWNSLLNHLKANGFSENEIVKAGLAIKKEKSCFDFFRNRIIFPVIDLRGNVIAFGGRVTDNSLPKYLNTSDTEVFKKRNNLYSLYQAKNSDKDYLILAEGYMDVIALHKYGFTNAVASLGTSFCEEHARLIKRFKKNVLICFDSDEAGKNAIHKAARLLLDENINVKIAILKGGKDPDEILKKYGSDYFDNIIKSSKPYIEFILETEKENIDLDAMEGKIKYIRQAISYLTMVIDPIERELYIKKLSNELDLSEDLIKNEYKKLITNTKRVELRKQENKERIISKSTSDEDKILKSLDICEGELINIIINNKIYFNKLSEILKNNYFNNPLYNKVFDILTELNNEQGSFDINMVVDRLPENEKGKIAMLKLKDLKYDINDQSVNELIKRISLHKNKLNIKKSDSLIDLNEQINKLRNRTKPK